MNNILERDLNQNAFQNLKGVIQSTYPAGRFVAVAGGKIVADAATFDQLDSMLHRIGYHCADLLVVQAGVDYPENVTIFI